MYDMLERYVKQQAAIFSAMMDTEDDCNAEELIMEDLETEHFSGNYELNKPKEKELSNFVVNQCSCCPNEQQC
ncbi:hypothetical protein ROHU_026897 [Labeo rohita]|uniref:Uncharacterized protein n=1 Tax=Labeo rohita TaxID=84645 RepID=A0A498M8W1_LABRO|nr:hypothetical protein ROHU_026897 [Labeo rohita]